jgi:hypothetical protein
MESYRISKHMNEYFDELFGMEEKKLQQHEQA